MQIKLTYKLIAALLLSTSLLAVAAQEKDWVKATTKDGAITFMVPPGYLSNDPNDPQSKEAFEKVRANNPGLAKMMGAGATEQQTLQMYDLNDSADDGVLDTFNVITQKNPGNQLKTSHYGEVAKQLLAGLPLVGKSETKVVDMPFGKTLTYWGTAEIKLDETNKKRMDILGFFILKGDKFHVISFATGEGQLKQKKPLFEKIVKGAKM